MLDPPPAVGARSYDPPWRPTPKFHDNRGILEGEVRVDLGKY
jgi:hypothetical protein